MAFHLTHHKGGTVWMNTTFAKIAHQLDIPRVVATRDDRVRHAQGPLIVSLPNGVAGRHRWITKPGEHRLFHLVRDPRDIIISGMHYHLTSGEIWLHETKPEYGNTTYQKALCARRTLRQRYTFEMNFAKAPKRMAAWDFNLPHCFECKYEELIEDTDARLFARIVRHLGFRGAEVRDCHDAFWECSQFGGVGEVINNHVRSGKSRQWEGVFDQALARAFLNRFGDCLIRAGYEKDHGWAKRLPERKAALDEPCEPVARLRQYAKDVDRAPAA